MSDAQLLESCWESLVMLAEAALQAGTAPMQWCELRFGAGASAAIDSPAPGDAPFRAVIEVVSGARPAADAAHFRLGGWVALDQTHSGGVPQAALDLIRLYGPVALAAVRARQMGRAAAFGHLAQSLDGKIATTTGHAHWIGDEANRAHAHRMRALCAGVLIGAGTLRSDKPRLNVRHVQGRDPVRIVLGSGQHDLTSLREASEAPIWLFGGRGEGGLSVSESAGRVAPSVVLRTLFERGVQTVYVEGGSETLSDFTTSRCLDVLQIHTAPLILGSGVPGLAYEGVETIEGALRFEESAFVPVGAGMMFVGRPRWVSDG